MWALHAYVPATAATPHVSSSPAQCCCSLKPSPRLQRPGRWLRARSPDKAPRKSACCSQRRACVSSLQTDSDSPETSTAAAPRDDDVRRTPATSLWHLPVGDANVAGLDTCRLSRSCQTALETRYRRPARPRAQRLREAGCHGAWCGSATSTTRCIRGAPSARGSGWWRAWLRRWSCCCRRSGTPRPALCSQARLPGGCSARVICRCFSRVN
jgi:hypothetical protein